MINSIYPPSTYNKIFQGTDISLSENRLFSLSVLYVFMSFFFNNASKDPLNSVLLSTHTFFGCFVVIISSNASAVVVA